MLIGGPGRDFAPLFMGRIGKASLEGKLQKPSFGCTMGKIEKGDSSSTNK